MKLTVEQLRTMIPTNPDVEGWCEVLNRSLDKYEITNARRIAGFVSQCAHESRDFTALEENLNYSQAALESVFKRYFGPGKRNAAEYARNPEKIANYVYQDEFRSAKGSLGNVKPNDGWIFRGRGLKQLTGRNNYTRFADDYGMTAEQAVDWVSTKEGALASALWFWSKNKLNAIADTGDVVELTKKINGGDIGLDDRESRYIDCITALIGETPPRAAIKQTARLGAQGEAVKRVQVRLGLKADGVFGPGTDAAVKAWQTENGLVADGIVGPKTLEIMLA